MKSFLKFYRLFKKLSNNEEKEAGFMMKSPLFKYAIISGIGFLLGIIILTVIIAIIFGPVMLSQQYIEEKREEVSQFFEKVGNVLTLNGWCSDSDGSCEERAEQRYYKKLDEVYENYQDKRIDIDVNLITGTIFYGYNIDGYLYETDENGINQSFVKRYCDANQVGWILEKGCEIYVKENYETVYRENKERYIRIATQYDELNRQFCKDNDTSIATLTKIPLSPVSPLLDKAVNEACEYYLWNYADLDSISYRPDTMEILYRQGIDEIETLVKNMVSGGRIDYTKYKNYLISTYIPKRFKEMYVNSNNEEKAIETIADEIMMFASKTDIATNKGRSYINNLCPEICTTSGDCYDLETYVAGVVAGESGMFETHTPNYKEQWKAQAVAARTYALAKTNWCKEPIGTTDSVQVLNTNSPQLEKIKEAIEETQGQVITYEGEVFSTEYDSFYKNNNFHCDSEECYATYTKKGPTDELSTPMHEISSYAKWKSEFAGGHGRGMSQFGAAYLADKGWTYDEILKYYYVDNIEISYIGGSFSAGEFTDGLLFPLGVNSKTGTCVSAGNYYSANNFHGAVDIGGWNMGYQKPYDEIPVIASIGGKITVMTTNQWCSNTNYPNDDTRLPRITGCIGNNVTILVTDPSSQWYNYQFIYYHLDSVNPDLRVGDEIETGEFLGYMGSTGNSTGYHLHYDIRNPDGTHFNDRPVGDYVTNLIESYCRNNIGS